jgi:outer membrane protein
MTPRVPVRLLRSVTLQACLAASALAPLAAQQRPTGSVLTLEQAIEQARHNNPNYLALANDQSGADWTVRVAHGNLLPAAFASGGLNYRKSGVQRIEGTTIDLGVQETDYLGSNYNLNVSWGVSGDEIFGLKTARANSAATAARIENAGFNLDLQVTLAYMNALRARDAVAVVQRRKDRAQRNHDLVSTRVDAGASAGIDRKDTEVALGRTRVALIEAERTLRTARLRLGEQIGSPLADDVSLAGDFAVFEPAWTSEELLATALASHPTLRAEEAQEEASRAVLRQARSQYLPSINVSTGFSGSALQATNEEYLLNNAALGTKSQYDRCRQWQDVGSKLGVAFPGYSSCGSPDLTDDARSAIIGRNDVFPFDFTKNPLQFSLGLQIPVFNGFVRERSVANAQAAASDATYSRRAEELRIRTSVTDQLDALKVAYLIVSLEGTNKGVAEERLNLARQRYALGAASVIELLDAETSMSQAEGDALKAQYDFHQALVALEAAVGRSLRRAAR